MNQKLSAAFSGWMEFTSQVQRMQRLLEQAVQRMQHRKIFMALDKLQWTMQEARRRQCKAKTESQVTACAKA